ncbi:hypothetical protein [Nocardiopsis synnemataformans]|uniref:hypothetical protein n=1 Tax=Nocardiopsis synnemataformans TaxID=61305 RepID=UPI003EB983B7
MSYTYYHGSQAHITDLSASNDICLVDDPDTATDYAQREYDGGHLHTIAVDQSIEIADEDDLRRATTQVLPDFDFHFMPLYRAADDHRVREALAAAGYDAVEYSDQTADGTGEHECLRVWNTALLTIKTTEEITQ